MLATLKRLFDNLSESKSTQHDQTHLIQVASVSLLICIARADLEFDKRESETIIAAAQTLFDLDRDETDALIELANRKQEASTSLYEFTAAINHHFDAQQKFDLIKTLWTVAFADHDLDRHEEHLIRRVADLIHVPHMHFIQAKLEVLETKSGEEKC